ncbi:MAG: DUF2478 domain-containing protein [Paracoccaceae bacterium]
MRLAYIASAERGRTDRVLSEAAARLGRIGLRLTGVVQTNIQRPQRFHCDMDLRILPDGPTIGITQDLGDSARGCRLDPGALENAVATVEARLAAGSADLLMINKFGKHEAEGRGFRPVIGDALARDVPVILGVNDLNRAAFETFAGGLAEELPADVTAICEWCLNRLASAA